MSSYNRMLVHRTAAYFGLDHNVDQSGQAVVCTKSDSTRLPDQEFSELIMHDQYSDEAQRRISRRTVHSCDEVCYERTLAMHRLLQGGSSRVRIGAHWSSGAQASGSVCSGDSAMYSYSFDDTQQAPPLPSFPRHLPPHVMQQHLLINHDVRCSSMTK